MSVFLTCSISTLALRNSFVIYIFFCIKMDSLMAVYFNLLDFDISTKKQCRYIYIYSIKMGSLMYSSFLNEFSEWHD